MGKKIVLCVDDEEVVLNSLEMNLTDPEGSYQIELAISGNEALELIEELLEEGHELAVVISDHIMPEMKGDELLIRVHHKFPAVVNILLTGQSQIRGVKNAINNAALYRYISKPWQKEDLLLTVKTALQKYQADQLLLEKKCIIEDMNRRLMENDNPQLEKDGAVFYLEDKLSDEELYDQIYYSRFFQSLDSKEKKWFALASIGLINADKKITRTKMNYLNSIVRSDRKKETVEYYISLIKQQIKPNLDLISPDGEKKYRMFIYLAQILISAKKTVRAEEDYFRYIGEQLGVSIKTVNEALKLIQHKITGNYMGFKLKECLTKPSPVLRF
jgi:FixJ family two-component response regulator